MTSKTFHTTGYRLMLGHGPEGKQWTHYELAEMTAELLRAKFHDIGLTVEVMEVAE